MKTARFTPFVLAALVAFSIAMGCTSTDDELPGPGNPDSGSSFPGADGGTEDAPAPSTSCGNKKIDQGEQCDDGNVANGDGCSATCTLESAGPSDVCPGAPLSLVQEDASTIYRAQVTGTTTGLFNHDSSSCGGGTGADAVYTFTAPMTGRAIARVTAEFGAILSARTGCSDAKTELACGDVGVGASTKIEFPVFAGAPMFLFVDGYGGAKGDFVLDLSVETAVCGNGKAEYPETCDDGNTVSNDGCSATCTTEDITSQSACPGMGYRLAPGKISFAGNTSSLVSGGGSAIGCAFTGAGENAIYAITPTVDGNLALDMLANYPKALLHVRRDCGENATQLDCVGSATTLTPLATSIAVKAEETVFVFVDGDSAEGSDGLYTLDATLTPAMCGNGKLDGAEECDDNNTAADDGCSPTCTVERQPESYTCPGKALRLEGTVAGPRTLKVRGTTVPVGGVPTSKFTCGSAAPDVVYQVTSDIDGWLAAKVSGPFNTAVGIRAACPGTADLTCVKTAPGNAPETAFVRIDKETPLFVFVDSAIAAKSGSFELELTVTPPVCGNDVIEGGETCDDGAADDGDGCSATCQRETENARDLCTTAPAITLTDDGDGTYSATVRSGNTNLTKPPSPANAIPPCTSTGPDAWFALTAPVSGVATVTISSATFRTTLGVRATCPATTTIQCDATNTKGGQQVPFPVVQGTTYFVGVSGVGTGAAAIGRFTLDVGIVPSGCGDTSVSEPEQCDDGNNTNGDGCTATCELEPLAAANACPGFPVNLVGASPTETRRATATFSTVGRPNNTGSTCGGSGSEGIVAIKSDVDGLLQVKATASAGFNVLLHARATCADPVTEIARASCTSGLSTFSTTVAKNTTTYLYVDGINNSAGLAKLDITVTP